MDAPEQSESSHVSDRLNQKQPEREVLCPLPNKCIARHQTIIDKYYQPCIIQIRVLYERR